jgi:hypothetical protein
MLNYYKEKLAQIVIIWVVALWNVVGEYQRFGGTCCLQLQGLIV